DLSLTKVRWSQKGEVVWSLTRPYLWRDMVLTGNEAGEILAFQVSDGAKQKTYLFKGTIRSIGGAGDVLYIGTLNGTLYAYAPEKAGVKSEGPATGESQKPADLKELQAELEKMLDEDQKFRTQAQAVEEKYGGNSKEV